MPERIEFDNDGDGCQFSCAPVTIRNDAPRPVTAAATTPTPPRPDPKILFQTTLKWRKRCLDRTAHIPSGYTYLGQLMGHDIGSSVPRASVPHAVRGAVTGTVSLLGRSRYNLIDNPLTLETIYGPGPSMLSHLYVPGTMLFRLSPRARLARFYPGNTEDDRLPVRALYDERNRDTLMLHELAVAWMQFHNLCASRLLNDGRTPFAAYGTARLHAVRVWHGIILGDILPQFLHPVVAAMDSTPPEWQLHETTLLHGLFRAFHAMPLAGYHLGGSGPHNLQSLMKLTFQHSSAEAQWQVDWPLFFGRKPGGPKTGISASVAPELRSPVTAAVVAVEDSKSAKTVEPLRSGNTEIRNALARLPAPWPDKLAPRRLADDFNARFGASPVKITAQDIEWGPLYQMIMIEAQLYGEKGGFGPFGSALLCGSIKGSIARIEPGSETPTPASLPIPETMLELIELVREVTP